MSPQHIRNCALAVSMTAFAGTGCDQPQTRETRPQENPVTVAFDALSSAIAGCGDELAACNDAFTACQQSAGAPAANALADAVVECTRSVGPCASDAGGPAASSCHEALQSCLGATLPSPPTPDDEDGGGPDADHGSPVASCIDTLLECVMQDGNAMACAQDVRACIIASVPAPPGVIPVDPGSGAGDAGMPEPPTTPDAGMPGDVEPTTPDAGMAGAPPSSSCMEAFEACVDAGGTAASCSKDLRECER